MEEFRTVCYKGNEFQVSPTGTIILNGKERKPYINTDGYWQISFKAFSEDRPRGWWSVITVHRLVAMAFVPNPNGYNEVNHKDYNRKNCCADNLEWTTHIENVRYSLVNKPDVRGEKNPNYGNRKLSAIYKSNPELSKEKQSRPGAQNGRCRKVELYCDDRYVATFPYIRACSQYLIDNGYVHCKSANSVSNRIAASIKKNIKYKKSFNFKFI